MLRAKLTILMHSKYSSYNVLFIQYEASTAAIVVWFQSVR